MNKTKLTYYTPLMPFRRIILAVTIGIVAMLQTTCEDRFSPDLDPKYENLLVVEGNITNQPGPYTVKLSASTRPDNLEHVPLSGYKVIISDDAGNSEELTETEAGLYMTDSSGIQGVIGRQYKIDITATNGKTYTSDYQQLPAPVGIDSVYAKIEYISDDAFPVDVAGYQFYINTKSAASDTTYLLWRLKATYEYKSDFVIRFIYDGELRPWTAFDSLRTCWLTKNIPELFVYGTENLQGSKLEGFPLQYVPVTVRDLSIRYSLLTSQYTLNTGAYKFWSTIKDQHSDQDQLYTRQPYQVRGNVYNSQNPEEAVLGYFMVAGETRKRIFVNRPDPPVKMRYPVCNLVEADYMNFGTIFLTSPSEWPQFATIDNDGRYAYPVNQECLDCRLRGGTIEKPDFWIDN